MENCIFCKIAKGEIPSVKIWESEEFLSILDIQPIVKGMTVVLAKNHYDSDVFSLADDVFQRFLLATKKTAEKLKRGLKAERVLMMMEGLEVRHAHIKLYPLCSVEKDFQSFKQGLKTSKTKEELEKIAREIKENTSLPT